ncbi:NYN domain-containing protein [Nostoc sp. RF31YmG]|nr:NYN domain-containing protein [Nostoc sp. RF31YmG]
MKAIHLSSNGQASHQKLLVSIYWDYQNAKLSLEQIQLLLDFAKSKGCLIRQNLYYNSQCHNQCAAIGNIASLNFNCIDVPCPLKNSADNQLIADCLEDIDSNLSPDTFILISGDGDFVKLVRNLQKLDKKVITVAQNGNVKQRLKELADEFYFVDNLPKIVMNKTQPQTTLVQSQISYNEAIEYLTEAIKTALHQRKPTVFGYIDKLMRQRCANYQGASSVLTPNGKAFSRFSKFIDAAVKDGKVKMQNQQLFLIELDKLAA